jgi:hypothetical protein
MKPLCVLGLTVVVLRSATPGFAAPANDSFANAISLSGLVVTTTGSSVGATKEPSEPNHGGNNGGASVWWTWTAPDTGLTTIDTFGSSYDTLLGVYVGTAVNQLTTIASNDDSLSLQSLVTFNAVAGTVYRIAVDGFGNSRGSITLHLRGPNGVSIGSPTNGAVFTLGDPIPFSANFSTNFPNPPPTQVDFYRGSVRFASSTNAPFTAVTTNSPIGTNSFYIVAMDSTSQSYTSSPVNVFIQNVGLTLLLPLDGSYLDFGNTNPIPVTAWTYLPSGTITNIEFLVDGQRFGQDTTAPFSAVWTNVTGGSHRLSAVGTSDTGASYNSQPVFIAVYRDLVPVGAIWEYLDDGSNQGTNWIAPAFDDSAWASGPSPLGYSDSNGRFPATTNSFGPDPNHKYITTYYRRTFVVTNLAGYLGFYVLLQRDDGAVVYLNGAELGRNNMPSGPITSTTLASTIAFDDGSSTFFFFPSAASIREGTNVIAVEVHQNVVNTPDLWFQLQMVGIPVITRNQAPLVALTSPTNTFYALAPASLLLTADASDSDGHVAKVEFFADGVKLGESTQSPYSFDWINPPIGPHSLRAVATDDQGATQPSAVVNIVVYDASGTPLVQITSPTDGTAIEGGTNLVLAAYASAPSGVTHVQFLAAGSVIGEDTDGPFTLVWDAPFGTNFLTAVAFDANGVVVTSAVVRLVAFPNATAPRVAAQLPLAGSTLTNFTSLLVRFSESVQHVDAGDLLVSGIPATGVTGSGSNYLFTFPQPPYGEVEIAWANGHGITDFGFPSDLAFNELNPDAQWEYQLVDRTSPTLAARTPAPGATVTNLTQVSVTFSEPVTGVDAADLLINGTPALALAGSGTSYTFDVAPPAAGTVTITWVTNHGIFDQAETPNAFVGSSANATWSFVLDTRVVLVQSNSTWNFVKGFAEASTPSDAWRQPGFDDSGWSNSAAPFFYGDPYDDPFSGIFGTLLSDMRSNYTTIFLRKEFVVENRSTITNLLLNHQSDDGFIAWINGVEVLRYNVLAGEQPYNGVASSVAPEPDNVGAAYIVASLVNNAVSRLVRGTNILAVQGFNQSLTLSSDFGFNAQLYYFPADASAVPPRLASADPAPGEVLGLTNVTITFSEAVTGVDATDLLINGQPASSVTNVSDSVFAFSFAQPAFGPVVISWAADHGIVDLDDPPKPFDGTASGATLGYTLINPAAPRIVSQVPAAGAIITNLTLITVNFSKPVVGVNPTDFLLNGVPATRLTGGGAAWRFIVTQPPLGTIAVSWATNHGIHDQDAPPNEFNSTLLGATWTYRLVDPAPSVVITSPTNGTYLTAPATVLLQASASDSDGTVRSVEYYEGTNRLGEATVAPYSFVWPTVDLGIYTLRAIATDNLGYHGTSAPVVVNVVTSLPPSLVRGPYLQLGSPTGGVVRWRTDIRSDTVVSYGTNPANLAQTIAFPVQTNEHVVALSGLEPDTTYYYAVGSSAWTLASGNDYWFKSSPPVGTDRPTRVWVLGDSGTANVNARNVRDAFYAYAATNKPADLWLMLGDNAYNSGLDTEYQSAVFEMYPSTLRNLFLWPTIGNHETAQAFDIADFPYLHIFTLPQQGEAGGVPSGTPRYYSFDYANIHFVCLDSMTSGRTATNAMSQWLRSDLDATPQTWVIVFFHHPPYTKGNHDSDRETELIEIRQNILPILESHGVDLVFSGHSHAWERSYLLNGHYGFSSTLTAEMKIDGGDGREDGAGVYQKNARGQGVVYTVAGNSGQITGGSLDHPAHFLSLNELGSMVVDVTSNRMDVTFLATTGVFRDHYSVQKRVPQPVPAVPAHLLALALNSSTVALTWDDLATNELSYVLERSLDGTNFTAIATNAANTTNASDTALLADTTYFYRVHASGTDGESDVSNVASATTVPSVAVPTPPADLVVSASTALGHYRSQLILRWHDRSANETGFIIERSDGGPFTPVGTVGANITLYIDRNLASATTYFYRVRCSSTAGDSAPSNVAADQTHPQSEVVAVGETAVFHAGIEGVGNIRYQWRYLETAIFGETNEMLVIPSARFSDEGAYSVAITDAIGATVSNPAWLYVLAPPSIVEQPASRTVQAGASVTFHVVADGSAPLLYQWRRDGVSLPEATEPELTINSATASAQGDYDVMIANEVGSVTSHIARLIVNTPPVARPDVVYRIAGENLAIEISDFLLNDEDPDAEPITWASLSPTSSHGATVTTAGRYVIYTALAGFNEDDTFTYTIADPRGGVGVGVVTVSVTENSAPVLAAIPDLIAHVLTPLLVTNVATDRDVSNRLTMVLEPGAPANAHFNPRTGVFRWTPTRQQAPGTNRISVRVTDDGRPPRSARSSFSVYVNDYAELTVGSAVVNAGDPSGLELDLFSTAEIVGLRCEIQFDGDHLTNLAAESLQPQLATAGLESVGHHGAVLAITALPGQTLQGTQHLAQLRFGTVPGQNSAFLRVTPSALSFTPAAGLAPTPLSNAGLVVIINDQPLLEAHPNPAGGGARLLKIYGKAGQTYVVEKSPRPADPNSWVLLRSLTLGAAQESFEDDEDSDAPSVFYRARR